MDENSDKELKMSKRETNRRRMPREDARFDEISKNGSQEYWALAADILPNATILGTAYRLEVLDADPNFRGEAYSLMYAIRKQAISDAKPAGQ
ncbi:hypothetical protein X801_04792 [Opisthorchis viverrini]|uniref:Uncharacterized protein n=1 Tax=Opisthorchis viverrini TaxID=6198 RepID=A0A1S8WXV3_OPIVI|nr:hypothetical protein X801_04792 [Opisthorchis viverrini]